MTGQSETESDSIDVKEEKNSLKINKLKVKNDLQYVCTFGDCDQVFKRLYRLQRHLRQHSGQRPFVCQMKGCERSFTCKTYLNKHMKRPHNLDNNSDKTVEKIRKQYICDSCRKTFKTKFQLRVHSYQHSGQKPFSCDKCEKQFATQSKLKSHLKTHEGYGCGREGCAFVANKWTELRKHIALLHNACHKCDICDKKFNNGYNLNLHKETIHSESKEKLICDYEGCDRSYSRKSSLMTHIRSCHNRQQFKCTHEDCDKSFRHKKSLNKHLESHSKPIPKVKKTGKIVRRKACKATHLTGVQISEEQTIEIMTHDLQFRKECIDNEIKII